METDVRSATNMAQQTSQASAVSEREIKHIFNMMYVIQESVKTIATDVQSLREQPGKNWQQIVATVISVVTTAGVTYILATGGK